MRLQLNKDHNFYKYKIKFLLKNKRDAHDKEKFKVNVEEMQTDSEDTNTSFEEHEEDIKGVQWYERWRRDNL